MDAPPSDPLDAAVDIARAIRSAGGRALVVGGWVRDHLLGRAAKDLDLEVYGVAPERLREVLATFGRVDTVGESFAVHKVRGIDVALPRRDSKVAPGHRGFEVTGDPQLSFEQAFRRRDFTVNAIGWDPLDGQYIDPYNGRADLARRLLRAVDLSTFGEDSLRVLRAVQLAARLEHSVDDATAACCRAIALDDLPAERIRAEIEKLLLEAERPARGFHVARDLGVVERLLPEMHALIGCPQEPEWHPEGDVWTHTLLVIDEARASIADLGRPPQLAVMLGAVCHDFGKPSTTVSLDGRIRSPNHEQAGVAPTEALLDRLGIHSVAGYDVRRQVVMLVAHHLTPGMWHKGRDQVGDGAFRRLALKGDLELLARLAKADCEGRSGHFDCSAMEWFLDRARALAVEHRPPAPLLQGRHVVALGVAPGPAIGAILQRVYDEQLDGRVTTLDAAIASAKRILGR